MLILAIEPVVNLAYPFGNISAKNGGPPTGTLIWFAVAAFTVTLSPITNEPVIVPPAICKFDADIFPPDICKLEELISKLPSEPLMNAPPEPDCPNIKSFVWTLNTEPEASPVSVLNCKNEPVPSWSSIPTPR